LGFWDAHGFGGERYDANLEVTNWCAADWTTPTGRPRPSFILSSSFPLIKPNPNRLVKELKPVAPAEAASGTYRVDMGVNYAGWFEMKTVGQPATAWSSNSPSEQMRPLLLGCAAFTSSVRAARERSATGSIICRDAGASDRVARPTVVEPDARLADTPPIISGLLILNVTSRS